MTVGDTTHIEWTDATWSPVTGCTKVSEGCRHCYTERTPPFRMEGRKFRCPRCGGSGYVEDSDGNRLAYGKSGQFIAGARCARCSGTGRAGIGDTTGVRMHEDRLDVPLRWRKPRKVFVCSMADLFHEAVSSSFIASVFAVMALTPQHTYQVLTKRPARMRALLSSPDTNGGRNPGDVWTIPTQPFAEAHYAVMAPALAKRCVLAGCKPGGTVLDPFSGSGTTGMVAVQTGRKYVGIELSADNLDLSLRTRFAQPALDFGGEAS